MESHQIFNNNQESQNQDSHKLHSDMIPIPQCDSNEEAKCDNPHSNQSDFEGNQIEDFQDKLPQNLPYQTNEEDKELLTKQSQIQLELRQSIDELLTSDKTNAKNKTFLIDLQRLNDASLRAESHLLLVAKLLESKKQEGPLQSLVKYDTIYIITQTLIYLLKRDNFIDNELILRIQEISDMDLKEAKRVSNLLDFLVTIIKEEIPLDIGRMVQLLKMNQQALPRIKDREIIVLLGNTGNGKSTTIHYFAGSKMEKINTENNVSHIMPTEITNQDAREINTSPFTSSVTKILHPVEIELSIGRIKFILLLDTPGFNDTEGACIDLVNGINVIDALKSASTVRPIIVLRQLNLGSRLEGIRELATIISQMIKNIEDYIENFQWIFTGFDEDIKNGLPSLIQDLLDNNQEQDSLFNKVLEDLLFKFQVQKQIYFVDPLDKAQNQVLRIINSYQGIKDPSNVFKHYLTQNAKTALNLQSQKLQFRISQGLHKNRFDLVYFNLNDLKMLASSSNKATQQLYKNQLDIVRNHINQMFKEFEADIQNFLTDDQQITSQDILNIRNIINVESLSQALKNKFFPLNQLDTEHIIQSQQYYICINEISTVFLNQINKTPAYNKSIKIYFQKLQILCQNFQICEKNYFIAQKKITEEINRLLQEFEQNQNVDETMKEQIHQILTSLKNTRKFIEETFYQETIQRIKQKVSDKTSEIVTNTDQYFSQPSNKLEEIMIQNTQRTIEQLRRQQVLLQDISVIDFTFINQKKVEIGRLINEYIEQNMIGLEKSIQSCKNDEIDQSAHNWKETMNSLKILIEGCANLDIIAQQNILRYSLFIKTLKDSIDNFKNSIDSILAKISNKQIEQYKILNKILKELKCFEWVDSFEQDYYKNTIQQVKQELNQNAQQLINELASIEISESKPQEIYKISLIIDELNQIQSIQIVKNDSIYNEIKGQISTICEKVEKLTVGLLNKDQITNFKKLQEEYTKESDVLILIGKHDDLLMNQRDLENSLFYLQEFISLKSNSKVLIQSLEKGVTTAQTIQEMHFKLIRNQSQLIVMLFQHALDQIDKFNGEDKKELHRSVDLLSYIFYYIKNSKGFKLYWSQLNHTMDIDAQFQQKIDSFKHDIEASMDQQDENKEMVEFKRNIIKTQELKRIDEYIKGNTFSYLYKDYQERYRKGDPLEQNKQYKQVIDHKFNEVCQILSELKDKSQDPIVKDKYNTITKLLRNEILEIYNQTLHLAQQTRLMRKNEESSLIIKQLIQNVLKLYDVKEESSMADLNITDKILQIKTVFQDNFKEHWTKAEFLLETNNYLESNQLYEDLKYQQDLFILDHRLASNELTEKQKSYKDTRDRLLKALIEGYKIQNNQGTPSGNDQKYDQLQEIFRNPPREIHNQFKQLLGYQEYYQCLKNLDLCLRDLIWQELQKIDNIKDYSKQIKRLQEIQRAINLLPDILREDLTEKAKDFKLQIESNEEEIQEKLQDDLEELKLDEIQIFLDSIKKDQSQRATTYRKQIKDKFAQISNKMILQINERLNSGFNSIQSIEMNIIIGIEKIKIREKWNTGGISEINRKQMYNLVNRRFNDAIKIFDQNIEQVQQQQEMDKKMLGNSIDKNAEQLMNNGSNNINNFENSVKEMREFLDYRNHNQEDCLTIIEDFDETVGLCAKQMLEKIQKLQEQLESEIKEQRFQHFQDLQLCFKNYNYIKNKLSKEIKEFFKNQEQMKVEIEKFEKINLFEQGREKILEQFDTCYKNLEAKISGIKTNFENQLQCEKFFIELESLLQSYSVLYQNQIDNVYIQNHKNVESFIEQIKEIQEQIMKEVQIVLKNAENPIEAHSKDLLRADQLVKNLDQMNKFKNSKYRKHISLDIFDETIQDNCNKIQEQLEQSNDSSFISLQLAKLKILSHNLKFKQNHINENFIAVSLNKIRKDKPRKLFNQVKLELERQGDYGLMIVRDHQQFAGESIFEFNKKTLSQNIDFVIANLKGDYTDLDYLKKQYYKFKDKFDNLLKLHLVQDNEQRQQNIKMVKNDLFKLQKPLNLVKFKNWEGAFKDQIPYYMAHIFAIWTLINSENYFYNINDEKSQSYLITPHPAQVITCFRMLGLGTYQKKNEKLSNNLCQVGTGEGKSLILAVVASIFALLGGQVYIACYSEMLSLRDSSEFKALYEELEIDQYVQYGNFNKLCENFVNYEFNIRATVKEIIQSKEGIIEIENQKQVVSVLLIDEVDVFFSKDFYGESYTPSTQLQSTQISDLIQMIWQLYQQNNQNIELQTVIKANEFKQFQESLGNWKSLALEVVKDMISDLSSYEAHPYSVKEGKICYKDQDKYIFNQVYGYQTMWAYFKECLINNRISHENLQQAKFVTIKCGKLSFTQVPKNFSFIIGVTGTLSQLTQTQLEEIKNQYEITKKTEIPTVFGNTKLSFDPQSSQYFKIEQKEQYYISIVNDIKVQTSNDRPVLLFFASEKKLRKFLDCKEFAEFKDNVVDQKRILTEQLNAQEKSQTIKIVCQPGAVTLSTRIFGRGSDFQLRDPHVASKGGLHVIQTFFSDDYSEEIQIKGRTARQGDQGSFTIIMKQSEVEKYISQYDQPQNTNYALLHNKRQQIFEESIKALIQQAEFAKKDHILTENFLLAIKKKNQADIEQHLLQLNKGILRKPASSTVIMLDGTGSMQALFQKTKAIIEIMISRLEEILKENNIENDVMEIQIVVYRNYSSGLNSILECSPWTSKSQDLKTFLNSQSTSGGQGNEAIEVGFWHVNQQLAQDQQVTQILLIGDAAPNTENEIHTKKGAVLSKLKNIFSFGGKEIDAKYYQDEMQNFIKNGIPVNTFYLENNAKKSFTQIAQLTNGRCQHLNIHSENASNQLTDLVSTEILRNIGVMRGHNEENKLIEAYKNKYSKQYL